jgi:hypothetical protein
VQSCHGHVIPVHVLVSPALPFPFNQSPALFWVHLFPLFLSIKVLVPFSLFRSCYHSFLFSIKVLVPFYFVISFLSFLHKFLFLFSSWYDSFPFPEISYSFLVNDISPFVFLNFVFLFSWWYQSFFFPKISCSLLGHDFIPFIPIKVLYCNSMVAFLSCPYKYSCTSNHFFNSSGL